MDNSTPTKKEETRITVEPEEEDMVRLLYPSNRITVEYEKRSPDARSPRRATNDSAGYDVFSAQSGDIPPGETRTFATDLTEKPALGFHIKLYNRSSLACKEGVVIPGAPMVIDRDYRGIIYVTLLNTSKDKVYHVKKGDRIAQQMVERSYKIFWVHRRGLSTENTERGDGGFGNTGK